MNTRRVLSLALFAAVWSPVVCYADGIDVVRYFTRVGRHDSVFVIAGLIVLLMVVNFLLNFLFIGLPAMGFGKIAFKAMAQHMIAVTLLGQIADRVGAYLATLGAEPVADWFGIKGEGSWYMPLVVLNYLFSGLAIAVLTLCFCRLKWKLAGLKSLVVVASATVFTNPAYLMILGGRM